MTGELVLVKPILLAAGKILPVSPGLETASYVCPGHETGISTIKTENTSLFLVRATTS